MTRFERDTAVTPIGDGVYEAFIHRSWWIDAGPNGGFLAAITLRAALAELGDDERTPRSLTLHYLRPPTAAKVAIHVAIERTGRRFSTATMRMMQGEKLCVLGVLACGTPRGGLELAHREAPQAPPSSDVRTISVRPEHPPLRAHFERRPVFGGEPWEGLPHAEAGGWIRLVDPPGVIDAPLLAAYCDVWPPALLAWAHRDGPVAGVSTVDLTIHFRCDPRSLPFGADAFVLIRLVTQTVRDGCLVEDGEVWSEDGVLLAECRQLAVMT